MLFAWQQPDPVIINVVDFRRQRQILEWNAAGGTWTACEVPPALVHGVAYIRASQPNICLFGHDDRLHLQIGADHFALSEDSPRILWTHPFMSFGLRNRFSVDSSGGETLYSHSFWIGQRDDFFRWLASRAADRAWRSANSHRWSEGVDAAVLRSS